MKEDKRILWSMKGYPRLCVGVPKINGDIAYQSHLIILFFQGHMILILLKLAFSVFILDKKLYEYWDKAKKIFEQHLMKKIGF